MNAKLYHGDAGAAIETMTVLGNAKDVTVTKEAGEADVTTRANNGWEATAPTLKRCTIEWEMLWKPGDTGFEAIRTAFLAGGTLELAALDQAHDVLGAEGPKGSFSITGFTRNEPLTEAMTVNVTAKLAGNWSYHKTTE
jgi:hypothetical protein